MKDNYFKLDDFFRRETPDKSTLNVFNETDDEPVLHVRYLNPKAILVTGKFSEQGLTVIIDNQEIKTDSPHSNHYRGGCGTASESGFLFN